VEIFGKLKTVSTIGTLALSRLALLRATEEGLPDGGEAGGGAARTDLAGCGRRRAARGIWLEVRRAG